MEYKFTEQEFKDFLDSQYMTYSNPFTGEKIKSYPAKVFQTGMCFRCTDFSSVRVEHAELTDYILRLLKKFADEKK